jgi:hypothetical protein
MVTKKRLKTPSFKGWLLNASDARAEVLKVNRLKGKHAWCVFFDRGERQLTRAALSYGEAMREAQKLLRS